MNSVFWHFKSTLQSLVPFKYLLMLTRNGNMFSFHYFTVNTSAYIFKKNEHTVIMLIAALEKMCY